MSTITSPVDVGEESTFLDAMEDDTSEVEALPFAVGGEDDGEGDSDGDLPFAIGDDDDDTSTDDNGRAPVLFPESKEGGVDGSDPLFPEDIAPENDADGVTNAYKEDPGNKADTHAEDQDAYPGCAPSESVLFPESVEGFDGGEPLFPEDIAPENNAGDVTHGCKEQSGNETDHHEEEDDEFSIGDEDDGNDCDVINGNEEEATRATEAAASTNIELTAETEASARIAVAVTADPPQQTGSGESWEPVEGDDVTMDNSIQYEILPGLWAHLSDDAVVGFHDVDGYVQSNENYQHFDVLVSAKKACLGCGSLLLGKDVDGGGYFFTGRQFNLRAQMERPRNAKSHWDGVIVRDIDISISGGVELDKFADRAQIVSWLEQFGRTPPTEAEGDHSTMEEPKKMPTRRMTKEEWQEFLRNVKEDKRKSETSLINDDSNVDHTSAHESDQELSHVDYLIPYAKVNKMNCLLSEEKIIEFPRCEGTGKCTLRTLLEYYFRAIVNSIDNNGDNPELGGRNSVADLASVKGSIVGAAAGAAVLGPIGFLAGTYLGSQMGRKHSGTVVGATAGACLFGPVGLIAGACYGESTRNLESNRSYSSQFGRSQEDGGGVGKATAEHIENHKYEYAGTAGVMAGAAAGSVAGPVGMVAGAFLGSVSARKVTESASGAAAEVSEEEGRRGNYRFGDITRGLVARGKQVRGADRDGSYQFGDFTRGLFGGGGKQ